MRLALAFLVVALASCGDGPTSPERRSLEDNRELFQSRVGRSYSYTYSNVCFCPVDVVAPVRISVRNGTIESIVVAADGTPVPRGRWELYETIDAVFAVIEDALDQDAARVDVTYDPALGYPRDVFIDYDERIADEERGFVISDVTAS